MHLQPWPLPPQKRLRPEPELRLPGPGARDDITTGDPPSDHGARNSTAPTKVFTSAEVHRREVPHTAGRQHSQQADAIDRRVHEGTDTERPRAGFGRRIAVELGNCLGRCFFV